MLESPVSKTMTIELIGVCTDICVISNALMIKAAALKAMPSCPIDVK